MIWDLLIELSGKVIKQACEYMWTNYSVLGYMWTNYSVRGYMWTNYTVRPFTILSICGILGNEQVSSPRSKESTAYLNENEITEGRTSRRALYKLLKI